MGRWVVRELLSLKRPVILLQAFYYIPLLPRLLPPIDLHDLPSAHGRYVFTWILPQAASGRAVITARQLESLVRLSEARARLELRNNVTRQDALDAIEVMKQVGRLCCDSCGCVT